MLSIAVISFFVQALNFHINTYLKVIFKFHH
jgi:hypothetical protein